MYSFYRKNKDRVQLHYNIGEHWRYYSENSKLDAFRDFIAKKMEIKREVYRKSINTASKL